MKNHIQITEALPRTQYEANGNQTEFVYIFPIFHEDNIIVYVDDERKTDGYSVIGAGSSYGGAVVFDLPPPFGSIVTLRRSLSIKRTSDFQPSGPFLAGVLNNELDYITAALQQVASEVNRTVRLTPTDMDGHLDLPPKNERANKLLGFDDNGDVIATPGGAGVGTFIADHRELTGLSADDHLQYHTDARGDARYYTRTQTDAILSGKAGTSHRHDADYTSIAHVSDTSNPHGVTAAQVGAPTVSRAINTQHSLTGGGSLSTDRILSLVNDAAVPGPNKVYGTDGTGARGWKNDPSGAGGVLTYSVKTASFTFDSTQGGTVKVIADHASAPIVATIPAHANVAFPVGTVILVEQRGTASLGIQGDAGVTLNVAEGKATALAGRFAKAVLEQTDTDTWSLDGNLAPA